MDRNVIQPPAHLNAASSRAPLRRGGLTLAELSVSLAVIATLMVATGSIMVLTGRAVAITAAQASEARVDDVIATMASEQRMALDIIDHNETTLTFTVADRDGDGTPETIKYTWSAATREMSKKINDHDPIIVLHDVDNFAITFVPHTEAAAAAVPDVESAEDYVYTHDTTTGSNYTINTFNWAAQSFVGKMGRLDAKTWRVTQVEIMGVRSGTGSGSLSVSVCSVDASGKPVTLLPLEKVTVPGSSLPTTLGWSQPIKFTTDQKLNPNDRYCIVVSQTLVGSTGSVSIDGASSDMNGAALKTSSAGALGWTIPVNQDMRIKVKGKYKYPGP